MRHTGRDRGKSSSLPDGDDDTAKSTRPSSKGGSSEGKPGETEQAIDDHERRVDRPPMCVLSEPVNTLADRGTAIWAELETETKPRSVPAAIGAPSCLSADINVGGDQAPTLADEASHAALLDAEAPTADAPSVLSAPVPTISPPTTPLRRVPSVPLCSSSDLLPLPSVTLDEVNARVVQMLRAHPGRRGLRLAAAERFKRKAPAQA